MEKFTPGPWIVNPHGGGMIFGPEMEDVATACMPRRAANAALIAAAPDIYAALELMVDRFSDYLRDNGDYGMVESGTIEARAALAKAEGRE